MHRASCRFMPPCGITETLSDAESVRAVHFQLSSGVDYGKPAISESDKAVMTANGYAGVCVNGKYIDWP